MPTQSTPESILSTCPKAKRARYRRRAERAAAGSYPAAVQLKCLECCAWDFGEAKRCEITSCALWPLRARIFRLAEPHSNALRAIPAPNSLGSAVANSGESCDRKPAVAAHQGETR